jgi:hypothetical protein
MKWTKEKPTKRGWYWAVFEETNVEARLVTQHVQIVYAWFDNEDHLRIDYHMHPDDAVSWSSEPIPEPTDTV